MRSFILHALLIGSFDTGISYYSQNPELEQGSGDRPLRVRQRDHALASPGYNLAGGSIFSKDHLFISKAIILL